jgi:hypothetical protein
MFYDDELKGALALCPTKCPRPPGLILSPECVAGFASRRKNADCGEDREHAAIRKCSSTPAENFWRGRENPSSGVKPFGLQRPKARLDAILHSRL